MMDYNLHITQAKKRITDLCYKTAGDVYVSFSGGKDSTIVLELLKQCELENQVKAVFCDTGIELKATKDFVHWVSENYYHNVEIIKPEMSFAGVIKQYGKPALSKLKSKGIRTYQKKPSCKTSAYLFNRTGTRFALADKDMHFIHPDFGIKVSEHCCREMKKKPFATYAKEHHVSGYFTGMRMAEGGAREFLYNRKKESGNICTSIKNGLIEKSPIIDWSDEMCDWFINEFDVPLSKAYTDYGFSRTGCFLCPYNRQLKEDLETLKAFEPSAYKVSIYWLKDVYIAQGIQLDAPEYMAEYNEQWAMYDAMRYEMLKKYRPDCKLCADGRYRQLQIDIDIECPQEQEIKMEHLGLSLDDLLNF